METRGFRCRRKVLGQLTDVVDTSMRLPCFLAFFVLGTTTVPACAHVPLPEPAILARIGIAGEPAHTARRIVAAEKLVAEQKWAEAIDEFQRIIREAGDDLVPLDPRHLINARRLCYLRLAAFPPERLHPYHDRVNKQADKW